MLLMRYRRRIMQNNEKLIPQKQVVDMTSLSGTTIWRLEKAGKFPERHKIGPNRVAWLHSDILRWIAEKVEAQ